MITDTDLKHLERCIELAKEAMSQGHKPFGSLLVSGSGEVLFEDYNKGGHGDSTQHPELAIARWAASHMPAEERKLTTVYTSGEHCAMCSAAHAWAGLGRIVFASSMQQLTDWLAAFNLPASPIRPLSITEVINNAHVDGPVPHLANQVHQLHLQYYQHR